MEKFTKLRDIDNMVKKDFEIIKRYTVEPGRNDVIVTEYINNGKDFVVKVYKKNEGIWVLAQEKIHINTDQIGRNKAFQELLVIDYYYNSPNFVRRLDALHSDNRYLKMKSMHDDFNLEEANFLDVNYFFGNNKEIFSKVNDIIPIDIDFDFGTDCIIKRFNYKNQIAVARKSAPAMNILYTDLMDTNKAVCMIDSMENYNLTYLYYHADVGVDAISYEYMNVVSENNPLLSRRITSISDIPIISKYDEYGEPLEFNSQQTFLGEFIVNDNERIRVYLYPAIFLEDRDIIHMDKYNLFYLDKVIISEYNEISYERLLIKSRYMWHE